MTQDTIDDLSQKQRDRLAYVEFRLWFLGDVCRRDLMERFGIAPAVATRDFTTYRDLAPQNIDFDGRRKVYVPSERFAPVFEHEPERVLSAISRGFGDGDDRKGAVRRLDPMIHRLSLKDIESLKDCKSAAIARDLLIRSPPILVT